MLSRPALVALVSCLVAGCFSDNGPGDTGVSGPGGSSTGTTDPATSTTRPEPLTDGTTTGTTSSTTDPSTTLPATATDPVTTAPPLCALAGEPCGSGCCGTCLKCQEKTGLCVANENACDPCQDCAADGQCIAAPPQSACQVDDHACTLKVYGPSGSNCHAYASAVGTCSNAGECHLAGCGGLGAVIASCPSAECQLKDGCQPDASTATVTFETLCAVNTTTDACRPSCSDDILGSVVTSRMCDDKALCAESGPQGCGAYKCSGDGCAGSCTDNIDCASGYECVWNSCEQP